MQCLVARNAKINDSSWLWHHGLAHPSMDLLSKLIKEDLVVSLLKLNFEEDRFIMHVN